MSLSLHVRGGVLAAAAAASLLGGIGIANAATPHTPATPVSTGNVQGLDVGTPSEAQPGFVIAPDGTRIWSTSPNATLAGVPQRAGTRTAAVAAALNGSYVDILVSGARQRASVPSGQVVGLAYPRDAVYEYCKIPNGGYTWGWTRVQHGTSYTYGWMRSDLFRTNFPGNVGWC